MVPLVSGGAKSPVTESNKIHYLNKLAEYRLRDRVLKEINEFIKGIYICQISIYCLSLLSQKGLNLLVPTEFFSIFDENELEVVILIIKIAILYHYKCSS